MANGLKFSPRKTALALAVAVVCACQSPVFAHGSEAPPLMDQARGQRHAPRNALARRLLHRRYGIFTNFGESGAHKGREVHG